MTETWNLIGIVVITGATIGCLIYLRSQYQMYERFQRKGLAKIGMEVAKRQERIARFYGGEE